MTESTGKVGPRKWAVLVLAGGAALSAPFLRNPGTPAPAQDAAANPLEVDFSKKSWPDLREKSLTPPGQVASNLSVQDWAELDRLKSQIGTSPRKVTGNLPSTSAVPLPAWADRGPRIDQLVNDSIRTEPLAPVAPLGTVGLDPLRPWMGSGMKINAESSPAPQSADLAGDMAFRAPNPDSRWNSVPSTSPSSDPLPQDSGALASNRPFRKFEDRVEQWPDEKLAPSTSQPPGFPVASQFHGPSPAVSAFTPAPLVAPTAKPEMVSAPMVRSQSGRQTPRVNSPAIEAPKPSTASPRPKHFIQQPAKRA